jgi:hypothetical protein
MLLMQFLQLDTLARNIRQVFRNFITDIRPSGRQQIHFYHRVAVVFECAGRHKPLAL